MLAAYTSKQRILIYSLVGLFALIYCSISLVNHYNFRTNAYDLGIYNNILYSYSHLKLNHTSIQQPLVANAFADHFEPVFFVFAPLYWVFGTYTLLIIQITLVLMGGLGAMKYIRLFSGSNSLSIAVLIQFYSMWGVYSALAFDFHNNVTGAMLVPWLMVFVHQKNRKAAVLAWAFILLSKENMALYGIFVCLGLALHYFSDKQIRNRLFLMSGISALYFMLVIKVIIPFFQEPGAGYLYDSLYRSVGSTPQQIIANMIEKPGYIFSLLFESYKEESYFHGIKSELHFSVLISGGIFLLYRPQFLIMLIPVYFQKLFNTDPPRWGINYHYSIEFVPVLAIVSGVVISGMKNVKIRTYLPFAMAAITAWYTHSKIEDRVSFWYESVPVKFYSPWHYKADVDVNKLKQAIKELPISENDAVSAQSALVPRLANRDRIYLYPNAAKADYIVLAPLTNTFPLRDQFRPALDTLRQSKYWELVRENEVLLLFKRKQP